MRIVVWKLGQHHQVSLARHMKVPEQCIESDAKFVGASSPRLEAGRR